MRRGGWLGLALAVAAFTAGLAALLGVPEALALVGGAASYVWVNGTAGFGTTPDGEDAQALAPAGNEG